MYVCACVQSCLTLWDRMNPTSPSKSRSDLPHWYPIIALHLNTSLVSLRVLATTIFIYSLYKVVLHLPTPPIPDPFSALFYSEHHLVSGSFGICCFQPVGGTRRNSEQGRRKRSRYFFPIASLLWCHVSGQWLGPSTMTAPMKQLLLHHSNSFFFLILLIYLFGCFRS